MFKLSTDAVVHVLSEDACVRAQMDGTQEKAWHGLSFTSGIKCSPLYMGLSL